MDLGLAGRRALVTGASSGLGAAIARGLAAEGAEVVVQGGLGVQPMAMEPHYNATLAARHNLAVSLARELKNTGVTSNVVAPGAIMTDATREFVTQLAPSRGWGEEWAEIERNAADTWVPNDVGRFGRAEEIAATVCFLASVGAAYVSGAVFRVDGGTIRSV